MQGAVLCCAGVVPGCRRGGCTPCARPKNMDEKMRMCVKGLQDHVRGKALPKISFGVQKFPVQPMTCKTTKGSKAASQRSRDGGQGRACWEHWGVALLSPLCTAWHVVSFRSKITASVPPLWHSPPLGRCCWSHRLQLEEQTGGFAPSLFSELHFPEPS